MMVVESFDGNTLVKLGEEVKRRTGWTISNDVDWWKDDYPTRWYN